MDNTEKSFGLGDGDGDGSVDSRDLPAGAGTGADAGINITRDGMGDKEEELAPNPSDNSGQGGELHGGTRVDTRVLLASEVLQDTATEESEPPGGDGLVHPRGALPAEEATPTTEARKEGDGGGGGPRGTRADAFPKEDATPTPPTITIGVILHGPDDRDGREPLRGAPRGALPAEEATLTTDAGMDVSEEPRILVADSVGNKAESFTKKAAVGNGQGANSSNLSEHGPGEDALTKSEVQLHAEHITGVMADSVPNASNILGATKEKQCVQLEESIGRWEKFLGQQQQLQTSLESRLTSFENRQVHFQEEQRQFAEQHHIDIGQLSMERCRIETLSAEVEAKQRLYLERQGLDNQANKRLKNTYYAAQLCGIYGREEVIGTIGTPNDENLHAALLNKPPKDGNAWSKKQTLYTVIFMVFLPLVFGLEVLFKNKKTNDVTQTIVFGIVGAVWSVSTIEGLYGLFNTWSVLPLDCSGHMARLMFLGICLLKVGALWYAMPSWDASIGVAIFLAVVIATGISVPGLSTVAMPATTMHRHTLDRGCLVAAVEP